MNTMVGATAMGSQPKATNRTLLAGFILSTIFTTGLTLTGGFYVQALVSQHADRKGESDQYQAFADAMDPLVTSFMKEYLAGRPTDKSRVLLQDNIQKQYVALEHAERVLSPADALRSKAYRDQIVDLSGKLDALPAPRDAQGLVQAIATARNTRADVAESLQRAGEKWFSV